MNQDKIEEGTRVVEEDISSASMDAGKTDEHKIPRILWNSVAPFISSGYGIVTRYFMSGLLNRGYTGFVSAYYGLQPGGIINWNGIYVLPVEKTASDQLGFNSAIEHYRRFKCDLAVFASDFWVSYQFAKSVPYTLLYSPIDHEDYPDTWLEILRTYKWVASPSLHGQAVLKKGGVESTFVPHGVNINIYKPLDKTKCRQAYTIDKDKFVIGIVAANNDTEPRKAWDSNFLAIKYFFEANPDAKKDTLVFIHTHPKNEKGRNLIQLSQQIGIHKHILWNDTYVSSLLTLPESAMAKLYNTFDVFFLLCLSEDTRVLTEKGIIDYKDLRIGDKVYTLNSNGKIELQPVEEIFEYDYEGPMYHIKSKQVDQLVTPNHRIYYYTRKVKDRLQSREVSKFGNTTYYIPVTGDWDGEEQEYLKKLYDSLMRENGSRKRHRVVCYTTSEKLKDTLLELCFKLGYGAKAYKRKMPKRRIRNCILPETEGWYISVNEKKNKGTFQPKFHMRREEYKGKVWCITTRNGTFFIERNGVISLTGNSRREGFLLPALEAQACGVPCILNAFSAMIERNLNGEVGWLVPPATYTYTSLNAISSIPDPCKGADALGEAYNKVSKREHFAKKALEYARRQTWDIALDKYFIPLLERIAEEIGKNRMLTIKKKEDTEKWEALAKEHLK